MQTKYLNDAILGNRKLVASFTRKGELLRLYYPSPDYRQYIDYCYAGLKVNDSGLVNLHDDINNVYEQDYIENTNILETNITNTYFKLKINQLDFVPMRENVLIKKYTFKNENVIDLDVKFLLHSKLISDTNNLVGAKVINNGIIQYAHDNMLGIVSPKVPLLSHQINDTNSNINTGNISDKDYIGMSSDSSISYDIGVIKPKETKELVLFIKIKDEKDSYSLDDMEAELSKLNKLDVKRELEHTKAYWIKYVKEHTSLDLKELTEYDKKVKRIYNRTILLYPLLTNDSTGGISASVEIDEDRTACGRYSYCWPRDAVFVTHAMDLLKMEKETEKFYKIFCKNTQSKNGMWEQRFFTDCRLAPCWGYQIDETASIVYGVFHHYEKCGNIKFLKDNLKMMEKAVKFLEEYVDDIINKTNKMHVSYDLWEMHEGIHFYSMVSIYSSFECMLKTYEILENENELAQNRLKQESVMKQREVLTKDLTMIKDYIAKEFYDESTKSFKRNNIDNKMDISMLGAVVPFHMFSAKEKKMTNTVQKINLTLRTYTGGYTRFEGDHYRNGKPWTIATLWMALYYIEINDRKKAKECLDFVVASSTKHGFLGEQVDNETMETNWVVGLTWAHAMFVIVLEELLK